jgi:hypothetical protein
VSCIVIALDVVLLAAREFHRRNHQDSPGASKAQAQIKRNDERLQWHVRSARLPTAEITVPATGVAKQRPAERNR